MSDLFIFDINDNLLCILSNQVQGACKFWGAPFKETVNKGSTFEFNVSLLHDDSQYIVAENQVSFKDKDGNFRLFTIKEPEEITDANGTYLKVICEPGMNELNDEFIEDVRPFNTTLQDALTRALTGCRWQAGITADFGINAGTNFYYINVTKAIEKIINTWGGELLDRITVSGNKITGRYIDILPRRGTDTGKIWEVNKDILTYSLKTQSYPKTALYGIGASLQTDAGGFTRKINFSDVEWKIINGDPVDKPIGQEWVGDNNALQVWGRPGTGGIKRHRFGSYEDGQIQDPTELLKATWAQLQQQTKQVLNLTMSVFLLGELAGYEHEKVRLGDTTYAVNKTNKKPIKYEERVISFTYDIADQNNSGTVELGDYIDLYETEKKVSQIESKLNDGTGIWNKAENPVINDANFVNIVPNIPQNFIATGLFKIIQLSWKFENYSYLANYELYASKTMGFTPDASNLVWKGKTGGYAFEAATNEQWYFRLRATNYAGSSSNFTGEITAQTVQVDAEDILPHVITDQLIAADAAIDFAKIANVMITNAMISGRLDANKINVGADTLFSDGFDPSKLIQTFFLGGVPTLTNLPAVDWVDDIKRDLHVGDIYFDVNTKKQYRFTSDRNTTWADLKNKTWANLI